MIQQQGVNQDWEGIKNGTAVYKVQLINPPIEPEQRGINIREAAEYVSKIRKDELITGNHPHVDIHFGNLHDKAALERDWGDIKNFPLCTYFIWDQRRFELIPCRSILSYDLESELVKYFGKTCAEDAHARFDEGAGNSLYSTVIQGVWLETL
jgi:hypothetical protein